MTQKYLQTSGAVKQAPMTIRDEFASRIAAGDAACESGWSDNVTDEALLKRAKLYYRIADAMLKARLE